MIEKKKNEMKEKEVLTEPISVDLEKKHIAYNKKNEDNDKNLSNEYLYNKIANIEELFNIMNKRDKEKSINDLYSFKNIAIFRKIANILLKKIIELYKDQLVIKIIDSEGKKKLNAYNKSKYYHQLNDIIILLLIINYFKYIYI